MQLVAKLSRIAACEGFNQQRVSAFRKWLRGATELWLGVGAIAALLGSVRAQPAISDAQAVARDAFGGWSLHFVNT
eukprot:5586601-Pleurochrysis_carterae.AAC.2